ncbi:sodium:dicarboxylate cotransporter (permease SLC13 domain) [Campylobacter blaseri]|uniref:Anion:sodium symporter n=1 Tax=Campylobacter blaseri TaxID=2042961 RepID=A0A2P8QZA2_9BACT|nr:DASS family sodium-coupled anion symporter [Campylobacter blaseri]PSM51569.1 anion:sodium symporter [Campylobacter blaseri]PSM53362.1 anion:sodium symporter [Campylobacter blaseri]QKF86657.1 sodium:dicarboxylate cotransporter (permease SLC13 domain) [Campylobacter blaseri]
MREIPNTYGLPPYTKRGLKIIVIAAIIALVTFLLLPYEPNTKKGLALLVFIGILWLTEAIHITITALLVPVLGILLGIQKVGKDGELVAVGLKEALANFASPTIFLFFGGFALATALHMQKLDKKIAMKIIALSGSSLTYAVIAICSVTALLSMWISNTATAAMMLPLAIGMTTNLDREKDRGTFVFILLGIAYSASIGGLGTIVGSPPNAIASAALGYSFFQWMKIGLPLMLVLFPLMFIVLYIVFKPDLNKTIDTSKDEDIPWTTTRILTMVLFIVTALLWIFSKPIRTNFGIPLSDGLIALGAASLVVILGLATWKEVSRGTEWGVLLLFGGGLSLSAILKVSGASLALGTTVANIFGSAPIFVVIIAVTIFMIVLTEFTSNTASAALLVPVFASIAAQMGIPKEALVLVVGLCASCAFMLPVATPPNAIVFGTGLIRQKEMIRAGMALNIVCVAVISAYAYLFLV